MTVPSSEIPQEGESLAQARESLASEAASILLQWVLRRESSTSQGNPTEKELPTGAALSEQDEAIIDQAIGALSSLADIVDMGFDALSAASPKLLKPHYIGSHFSECLTAVEPAAFDIYLEQERQMFARAIELWVRQNQTALGDIAASHPAPSDFAREVVKKASPLLRRLEFRAGQMRKARGGASFHLIVEGLLRRIGVPCQRPTGREARRVLKRIDLVVPDQETALSRPDTAFFLSCKRTLRERWKQTIPERRPAWRVYLVTVDDSLPEEKAEEIDEVGMIVYVKDDLKQEPHLGNKPYVRSLSDLPRDIGYSDR